jgi:RNA polymerase sigma-70 factor (ECF subfamily)
LARIDFLANSCVCRSEGLKSADSDKQLVEQILDGKVEVFNLLVWRWQSQLYNFLLRLTGNRELAQDICQEAFLRSYVRLKELRDKEKFASWLFRIAVNIHRSERRRPTLPVEDSTDLNSLGADATHFRPGTREMQLTLRTLVSRLSPEHRAVVLLRVFHGFQFDQMAIILDCPVSTLKSRLSKAFEELRAGLVGERPPAGS